MAAGRCMSLGLGIVFGFVSSWAVAADSAVDKALEQSKQTGLPILAVAGSKT